MVLWVLWSADSEQHLALHAVLQFSSSQHHQQHCLDGVLRVLLTQEVLNDPLLRHLGANGETALQLSLDLPHLLLLRLTGEPLCSCEGGMVAVRVKTEVMGTHLQGSQTWQHREWTPETDAVPHQHGSRGQMDTETSWPVIQQYAQ